MKSRKTFRDTLREKQKGLDAWAAAYGKPQTQHIEVAEKRTNTKRMTDHDTEAAVMQEVIAVVKAHPNVLFAVRQNSGMSYNDGGAPVFFYRWIKQPIPMRIVDVWGLLRDGRMLCLEVKHRKWTKPSGIREGEQEAFLLAVKYAGGVSGFVTSAAEAQKVIDG